MRIEFPQRTLYLARQLAEGRIYIKNGLLFFFAPDLLLVVVEPTKRSRPPSAETYAQDPTGSSLFRVCDSNDPAIARAAVIVHEAKGVLDGCYPLAHFIASELLATDATPLATWVEDFVVFAESSDYVIRIYQNSY
jgi:hypothetical protein